MRKKQQKKAEAEKARAASAAKSQTTCAARSTDQHAQSEGKTPTQLVALMQSNAENSSAPVLTINIQEEAKDKQEETKVRAVTEKSSAGTQIADHNKPHQDDTTNTLSNDVPAALENKSSNLLKEEPATEPSPVSGTPNTASGIENGFLNSVVVPLDPPAESSNSRNSLKKTRPIPAVPHLKLPFRQASAHSKTTQQTSSAGSSRGLLSPLVDPTANEPGMSHSNPNRDCSSNNTGVTQRKNNHDATSETSSITLQEDPEVETSRLLPEKIPSVAQQTNTAPTTSQVDNTEMQAVSDGTGQEEAPKKKKKRSKKKSKKPADAPAEASEPLNAIDSTQTSVSVGSDDGSAAVVDNEQTKQSDAESLTQEDYLFYDPFNSQMTHIDAIRRGVKNPNHYFAQVNARMAAEEERKATQAENANEASEPHAGSSSHTADDGPNKIKKG